MTVNYEPEFLVISGVGLLGKSHRCRGGKNLSLYISENFSESSSPLRIIVEHGQEKNEFICLIDKKKMTICTDSSGKRVALDEKSIEEAIALMSRVSTKEEREPKFDTLKLIMGFVIFWVILLALVDQFSPQPTEATQARRDCLANAALLALKNDDADRFSNYSRRCY